MDDEQTLEEQEEHEEKNYEDELQALKDEGVWRITVVVSCRISW